MTGFLLHEFWKKPGFHKKFKNKHTFSRAIKFRLNSSRKFFGISEFSLFYYSLIVWWLIFCLIRGAERPEFEWSNVIICDSLSKLLYESSYCQFFIKRPRSISCIFRKEKEITKLSMTKNQWLTNLKMFKNFDFTKWWEIKKLITNLLRYWTTNYYWVSYRIFMN